MSVPKGKRKESQFEVIKHFYRLRKDITDLLLRDFGYSQKKSEKKMSKMFGGKAYSELSDSQQEHYNKTVSKNNGFEEWFIGYQRDTIMDCIRNATEYIFTANSIYPSIPDELTERRIYQDKAIGQCYRLLQELQYTVEVLPVDIQKYIRFTDSINKEINLLKGWRKADNKFKQIQYALTDSGRIVKKIHPKRLTAMRRKLKKLVQILSLEEFINYYNSWFKNYYKTMSKQQRENMNILFYELKEVYYV